MTKEKYEFVINRIFGGNSGFLEKQDQGSPDQGSLDQGSVQNESNRLNKLTGVIDCSST